MEPEVGFLRRFLLPILALLEALDSRSLSDKSEDSLLSIFECFGMDGFDLLLLTLFGAGRVDSGSIISIDSVIFDRLSVDVFCLDVSLFFCRLEALLSLRLSSLESFGSFGSDLEFRLRGMPHVPTLRSRIANTVTW